MIVQIDPAEQAERVCVRQLGDHQDHARIHIYKAGACGQRPWGSEHEGGREDGGVICAVEQASTAHNKSRGKFYCNSA